MKRKMVIIIIAVLTISSFFVFTACGKKDEESQIQETQEQSEEMKQDEKESTKSDKVIVTEEPDYNSPAYDEIIDEESNGEYVGKCYVADATALNGSSIPLDYRGNMYYELNYFIEDNNIETSEELFVVADSVSETDDYVRFYVSSETMAQYIECTVNRYDCSAEYKQTDKIVPLQGSKTIKEEKEYPGYSIDNRKKLSNTSLPIEEDLHFEERFFAFCEKYDLGKQFTYNISSFKEDDDTMMFNIASNDPDSDLIIHCIYEKENRRMVFQTEGGRSINDYGNTEDIDISDIQMEPAYEQ